MFKLTAKEKKEGGTKTKILPWVEKYRPNKVSEISSQEEVTRSLANALVTKQLPHLLFYGPPGTGKTTSILALAKQLFVGERDFFRSRVLELNASDERGIKIIREKVKTFASVTAGEGTNSNAPPFKLIILDEADSLTVDAQNALRRTMEQYSRVTRFCLICNYVSRIIDPIASRCAKFRFKPLDVESMKDRLGYICKEEGITCDDKSLVSLIDVSNGDLRKAINFLQSANSFHGTKLISDHFVEIAGVIPTVELDSLVAACEAGSFDQLQNAVTRVIKNGYSANQIVAQINRFVINHTELSDKQKAEVGWKIAKIDRCLVDGGDEFLQVLDLCGFLMNTICGNMDDNMNLGQ